MKTIGEKLSPILEEVEMTLLEFTVNVGTQPKFTKEGFTAAITIFSAVIMDKMYTLQTKEKMTLDDKCDMATRVGEEIKKLVKTFTDIDTLELYKT